MAHTDDQQLLPCPFCGITPTRRDNVYRYGSIAEHPEGSYCVLANTTIGIKGWNSRVSADAVPTVDDAQLWGELLLGRNGEAHFICHTKDEDFAATKIAFEKFIALLQRQVANERECPFFATPVEQSED